MTDGLSLGEKISNLRKKFGLTQDEFGEKIDVSRQSVANWEKNISAPKADKILDICRVFNIDSNYFYKTETVALAEKTEISSKITAQAATELMSADKSAAVSLSDSASTRSPGFVASVMKIVYFFIPMLSLSVLVISAVLLWTDAEFRESDTGKGLLMALTVLAAVLFVFIAAAIARRIYKILLPENESKRK